MTCRCGCGRPVRAKDYAEPCYRRWARAGRPAAGPPPPMSLHERLALMRAARDPAPDPYDLTWLAGEPERRADRARPVAADLIRCVAASDAEGVRLLLARVRDWPALAVVLAECCEPGRAEIVCGIESRGRAA